MPQTTPELEGVITSIVYLECKLDAIINILHEAGVSPSREEVEAETHKIHAEECDLKRKVIIGRMTDSRYDIS